MLPTKLLAFDLHGTSLVPRYLTSKDEPWVRELASELDALVGRRAREIDEAWDAGLAERVRACGARRRALEGMRHVCMRRWTFRIASRVPPRRVREVVFPVAAESGTRAEAIVRAATALSMREADVAEALFADRVAERRLAPPAQPLGARELVEQYNLALVQGLLLHALEVVIHARSQVPSIVRFAKLRRLLCTFDADGDGLRITVSGPLAVLRETTKYGAALATFLPAVLATPGWSLEARCDVRGRCGVLRASAGDPIASTHALPREVDSAVERRLLRDVRALSSDWTIAREADAVRAGERVFFPDFTLSRGDARVLVEIVGFYTPEYLASKLHVVREAGLRNLVVCVDESLACGDDDFAAPEVFRYRRRVDPRALLDAAERLASRVPESPALPSRP